MFTKKMAKAFAQTALLISAAMPAQAKDYTHSLGTVEINEVPKRVVVLGYGSLDFVDALGVTPIAMPQSLLPANLAKYKGKEFTNTGSLKEVNYETLFTLKPDLIIAEGRMAKIYKDLKDIAPVYMFQVDNKDYWKSTKAHWETVSEIFDKEEKGAELIKGIQTQIDELKQKNTQTPQTVLSTLSNGSSVMSLGSVSRFSFVYNEAGLQTSKSVNVKAKSRTHGDLISFEYIADAKPDILLVLDRDQAIGNSGKAKELFNNDLVNSTPAAKNGKIIYLDTSAWYLSAGGYQTTQTMIDELNHAVK